MKLYKNSPDKRKVEAPRDLSGVLMTYDGIHAPFHLHMKALDVSTRPRRVRGWWPQLGVTLKCISLQILHQRKCNVNPSMLFNIRRKRYKLKRVSLLK